MKALISPSERSLAIRMLILAGFALALPAVAAHAPVALNDVRVGQHKEYDRIVFELQAPARYEIDRVDDSRVDVKLYGTSVSPQFKLPTLPKSLRYITAIDAYRVGENDLVLEVKLNHQPAPTVFGLEGTPWRLVLDLTHDASSPPADASTPANKKPDYIPGDRPIETRMAEAHQKIDPATKPPADHADEHPESHSTPETAHPDEHASEHLESQHVPETIEIPDHMDSEKLTATLAMFFALTGDSSRAREYAEFYHQLVDSNLELYGAPVEESETASVLPLSMSAFTAWLVSHWIFLAVALIAGLAGGVAGSRIRFKLSLPKLKLPKFRKRAHVDAPPPSETEVAGELKQDIKKLKKAEKTERLSAAMDAPAPSEPEPEPVPVEEPVAVEAEAAQAAAETPAPESDEVKETAMERRVKRVLELNQGGADIPAIAKELEMSQDEVKLILDLN